MWKAQASSPRVKNDQNYLLSEDIISLQNVIDTYMLWLTSSLNYLMVSDINIGYSLIWVFMNVKTFLWEQNPGKLLSLFQKHVEKFPLTIYI